MEPRPEGEFLCIPEESQHGELLSGLEGGLGPLEERRRLFQRLQFRRPGHPGMEVGKGLLDGGLQRRRIRRGGGAQEQARRLAREWKDRMGVDDCRQGWMPDPRHSLPR